LFLSVALLGLWVTTIGKAFGRMVCFMPTLMDSSLVCQRCRDKSKCSVCAFKTMVNDKEKAALTAI
jgi:hypothetical protein